MSVLMHPDIFFVNDDEIILRLFWGFTSMLKYKYVTYTFLLDHK